MSGLLAPEHLGAVAVIGLLAAAIVVAARWRPGGWITPASRALAVVLVSAEVAWWVYLATGGSKAYPLESALPLQLCDAAILIAAAALWFRRPLLVEVTYFWGLAGTLQALVTPALSGHFPTFTFFQYYVAHGGVVVAALFLVVGLRQSPRADAVVRITALTIAYAILVGLVDLATGADYMFLREKPPSPTLLDYLGAWPWYLASATLLGMALFLILDAPFRVWGRGARR